MPQTELTVKRRYEANDDSMVAALRLLLRARAPSDNIEEAVTMPGKPDDDLCKNEPAHDAATPA